MSSQISSLDSSLDTTTTTTNTSKPILDEKSNPRDVDIDSGSDATPLGDGTVDSSHDDITLQKSNDSPPSEETTESSTFSESPFLDLSQFNSLMKIPIIDKDGNILLQNLDPTSDLFNWNNEQLFKCFLIEFKGSRSFFISPFQLQVDIGSYVIVEADRGFNLGVITKEIPFDPSKHSDLRHVQRLAFPDEILSLSEKARHELQALTFSRNLVQNANLDINIIDTEFQFDHRKLTIFFTAKGRVDFRDFVKDLFKHFKSRIWMTQLQPAQLLSGVKPIEILVRTPIKKRKIPKSGHSIEAENGFKPYRPPPPS